MKIRLDQDSLHFQLASFLKGWYNPSENLCDYTRDVLQGLIGAILISLISSMVIFVLFLDPILYIISGSNFGYFDPCLSNTLQISVVLWSALLIYFSIFIAVHSVSKIYDIAHSAESIKFISAAYRNFKEKTCIKIEWGNFL